MNVREAFNVREYGDPTGQPMLFAHGFGCEQGMWRYLAPQFADRYRVVLFDLMGLGGSDIAYYDPVEYADLDAYARDVLRICEELDLSDVIFVGHSVSAMVGALAARSEPGRFSELIMICPSARYVDEPETGYRGGFSRDDIDGLLATLSHNYMGWAADFAPVVTGAPSDDPLSEELAATFCRADPEIAQRFATATFLGDNRADLPHVGTRTLVLQTARDVVSPPYVGEYVAEHLPHARLVQLEAVGHCPNMSAPEQTASAIKDFL